LFAAIGEISSLASAGSRSVHRGYFLKAPQGFSKFRHPQDRDSVTFKSNDLSFVVLFFSAPLLLLFVGFLISTSFTSFICPLCSFRNVCCVGRVSLPAFRVSWLPRLGGPRCLTPWRSPPSSLSCSILTSFFLSSQLIVRFRLALSSLLRLSSFHIFFSL